MSETKATPGPWTTQKPGDGYHGLRVVGPRGGELCRANEANARLIAAAPDLLAACEATVAAYASGQLYDKCPLGLLKAAVARARGVDAPKGETKS